MSRSHRALMRKMKREAEAKRLEALLNQSPEAKAEKAKAEAKAEWLQKKCAKATPVGTRLKT